MPLNVGTWLLFLATDLPGHGSAALLILLCGNLSMAWCAPDTFHLHMEHGCRSSTPRLGSPYRHRECAAAPPAQDPVSAILQKHFEPIMVALSAAEHRGYVSAVQLAENLSTLYLSGLGICLVSGMYHLLAMHAQKSMQVCLQAGYLTLDSSKADSYQPPKELAAFLEKCTPIYIGFGSLVVDDPEVRMHLRRSGTTLLHCACIIGQQNVVWASWCVVLSELHEYLCSRASARHVRSHGSGLFCMQLRTNHCCAEADAQDLQSA